MDLICKNRHEYVIFTFLNFFNKIEMWCEPEKCGSTIIHLTEVACQK
jgi:hypothetical protein